MELRCFRHINNDFHCHFVTCTIDDCYFHNHYWQVFGKEDHHFANDLEDNHFANDLEDHHFVSDLEDLLHYNLNNHYFRFS